MKSCVETQNYKIWCGRRTTGYNVHIYPNQLKKTKKRVENCIPSNYSPCFLKLPKWNCTNHLIFSPEFPDFPCSFDPIFNGIALYFVGSVFDSEDDLSLGADAQGFSTSSPPHFSPASSSISTGWVTEQLHVRPPPISNHSWEGGGGGVRIWNGSGCSSSCLGV